MTLHLPPIIPTDAPLLVAYSGGADSALLLTLAKAYGDEHKVPVYAAHLHHGIRGEEADRDLTFCRQTAAAMGIDLIEKHVDVPALSRKTGQSIETAARDARYAFFEELMQMHRLPILLTAHHADDQLETLLFRFLRGSGSKGMGGIPQVRPFGGGWLIRPLLAYTKAEILCECQNRGIAYVTDSTNLSPSHTRNRLRHSVIPLLEELTEHGTPQHAAARLSHAAREDEDCLSDLAKSTLETALSADGHGLSVTSLQGSHPAISKRMIAMLYETVTAETNLHDGSGTLTAAHLEALLVLAEKSIPESALSLPRNTEARIRDGFLYIYPATFFDPLSVPPMAIDIGEAPWGDGVMISIEASPIPLSPASGDDVFASATFPANLPLPLVARTREAGDEIFSHGMHKKLKKLLCDKNIPPHLRDRLPLLCLSDGTPLWYPSVAFRDGYPAPTKGACLRITVRITKNNKF